MQLFLERHAGAELRVVEKTTIEAPPTLKLMMNGDGAHYSFFYDAGDGWHPLQVDDDGSILSTEKAGGFVGTVLGPFARQE